MGREGKRKRERGDLAASTSTLSRASPSYADVPLGGFRSSCGLLLLRVDQANFDIPANPTHNGHSSASISTVFLKSARQEEESRSKKGGREGEQRT